MASRPPRLRDPQAWGWSHGKGHFSHDSWDYSEKPTCGLWALGLAYSMVAASQRGVSPESQKETVTCDLASSEVK